MTVRRAVLWLVLAAVFAPSSSHGAEQALLGGRKARFLSSPYKPRARIEFRDDPSLGALGDPRGPAVSRLRLTTSAERFTQIDLPCEN